MSNYQLRACVRLILVAGLAVFGLDLFGSIAYARDSQATVDRCLSNSINQLDCGFKADDMGWGCESSHDVKCATEACMANKCCSNIEAGAQCGAMDNYYALGCGGIIQEYWCGIDSPNPSGGWNPQSCREAGNVWWLNVELEGGGVCRPQRGLPMCEEAVILEDGICREDGATCESDEQCYYSSNSTCVGGRCRGDGERAEDCHIDYNCQESLICAGFKCVPKRGLSTGESCTDGSQCIAPLVCLLTSAADLTASRPEKLLEGRCTSGRITCPLTCVKWIRPGVCVQELSLCDPPKVP